MSPARTKAQWRSSLAAVWPLDGDDDDTVEYVYSDEGEASFPEETAGEEKKDPLGRNDSRGHRATPA